METMARRMRISVSMSMILILLGTLFPGVVADASGPYDVVNRLPSPRWASSSVVVDGVVYVFGGFFGSASLDEIVRWDPATGSAPQVVARLPEPSHGHAAVWTGEFVYLFGGRSSDPHRDYILKFDPQTNNAPTPVGATFPSPRSMMAAVWDGRDIFLFGGTDKTTWYEEIFRFNPETEQMTELAVSLPSGRGGLSAAFHHGSAYVFGGRGANGVLDEIVRYDLTSSPPVVVGHLPQPWYAGSAVSSGPAIILIGGQNGNLISSASPAILSYDPDRAEPFEWLPKSLPTGRYLPTAVWANGQAFAIGGYDGSGLDEIVEVAYLTAPAHGTTCIPDAFGGSLIRLSWTPGLGAEGYRIYRSIDGGPFSNEGQASDLYLYDVASVSWEITYRIFTLRGGEQTAHYKDIHHDPTTIGFCAVAGFQGNAGFPESILQGDPPARNTYGWTTQGNDLDREINSAVQPQVTVPIDMGDMTAKSHRSIDDAYTLELDFAVMMQFWYDKDGVFDPVNGPHDGNGDDACPIGDFPIITAYASNQEIGKIMTRAIAGCDTGEAVDWHVFEMYSTSANQWNQLTVPADSIHEGVNQIRFVFHERVSAGLAANHVEPLGQPIVKLNSVAIELAAPPLFILHGWTPTWNAGMINPETHWTGEFRDRARQQAIVDLGQDPWAWTEEASPSVFTYDRHTSFRKTASRLAQHIDQVTSGDLRYNGDVWLFGHSMGGLVVRWYAEMLSSPRVSKLGQTATPNLGSDKGVAYTANYCPSYMAEDGSALKDNCFSSGGWQHWEYDHIGAYATNHDYGDEHTADFELRDEGNPVLNWMNTKQGNNGFPAHGVQYFTVLGIDFGQDCWQPNHSGDLLVTPNSGTLGDRIPAVLMPFDCDTNGLAFHEEIPADARSSRWHARYFLGLTPFEGTPGFASYPFPAAAQAQALISATDEADDAAAAILAPPDRGPSSRFASSAGPLTWPAGDNTSVLELHISEPNFVASTFVGTGEDSSAGANLSFALVPPEGASMEGIQFEVLAEGYGYFAVATGENASVGVWKLEVGHDGLRPPLTAIFRMDASGDASRTVHARGVLSDGGNSVTVLATPETQGVSPADAVVSVTDGNETWALLDDGSQGDLEAGDGTFSRTFSREEIGPESKQFQIHAEWQDESRSWARQDNLFLTVVSLHDIRVDAASGQPDTAWGGDAVDLSATMATSKTYQGDVTLSFYDGDPKEGRWLASSVVQGAGNTATNVSVSAVAPTHVLDVHVVATSLAFDPVDTNNVFSARMPFIPTPKSSAVLEGVSLAPGWFTTPVNVSFEAFDGSGYAYKEIWFNRTGTAPSIYTTPILLNQSGIHGVSHWAIDQEDNVEPLRSAEVWIDLDDPSVSITNPENGSIHFGGDLRVPHPLGTTAVAGEVELEAYAMDNTSGVASVQFWLDDDVLLGEAVSAGGDTFSLAWDSSSAEHGHHELSVVVQDHAGRTASSSLQVEVVDPLDMLFQHAGHRQVKFGR